ncbi:MAG: hypothetical protein R8M14_04510 [Ghiorsea sp.]
MISKSKLVCVFVGLMVIGWSSSAFAFANSDIFDSILSSHQDESRPKGMPYIDHVEQIAGTYNAWTMGFRAQIKDVITGEKKVIDMPTTLRYAGNALYIKIKLADVDRRVVDAVFEDLSGTMNDLKDYDSGDLKGFKSNIGHNTQAVILEGSINVAGKSLDDLRDTIVQLRSEMTNFYEELYESNIDSLENYFENVLDKKYPNINEAQTFLEIIGHDFTLKNQLKQRQSQKGHWERKVGQTNVETVNFGDRMQESILLKTGSGISQYKTEKMFDELMKRASSHPPKGSDHVEVKPHPQKVGVTEVVYVYPYSKKIDGADLRVFHEKFLAHVSRIDADFKAIIKPYYQAPAKKKILSLGVDEFIHLIEDGLESLPVHDVALANGQWKFKYAGVAYIITNYKSYMELSFIFTLPRGMDLDKPSGFLDDAIEENYASFADKYGVGSYKNSQSTVMVRMQINYGLKGSNDATGEKIKTKYDAFTRKIALDLQQKLKQYVGL